MGKRKHKETNEQNNQFRVHDNHIAEDIQKHS